jgi:hypothetical protein
VQVDDAEERVATLLRLGVLAKAPGVVAEGLGAGRLDAAEDAHGEGSILSRGTEGERSSGRAVEAR